MRRATASVFLLALTLVPLVLLTGCGDSEDYDQHELIFTSPAATEVEVVDSNDDGEVRGDIRAFTLELFEEGSDEPVGRLDGMVVVTDIDERDGQRVEIRSGQVQFSLQEGNIIASGNYVAEPGEAVPTERGFERAIVGGTGAYVGARGQVTQTAVGKDEYQAELDFETPRG